MCYPIPLKNKVLQKKIPIPKPILSDSNVMDLPQRKAPFDKKKKLKSNADLKVEWNANHLVGMILKSCPQYNLSSAQRVTSVLINLKNEIRTCQSLNHSQYTGIERSKKFWKIVDVPGDGNCWIYAPVLSMWYNCTSIVSLHCQEYRDKISDLLKHVGDSGGILERRMKRYMGLSSSKGKSLENLASCTGFTSLLQMLSKIIRIGTPGQCTWSEDVGEEICLLATVLNVEIIVYVQQSCNLMQETNDSPLRLTHDSILTPAAVHKPFQNFTAFESQDLHKAPIVFSNGNHFQCLLPPLDFEMSSISTPWS